MTWTRLMYIKNMHKAMQRVKPGQPLQQLAISKRYQGELRKQFRIAGVPWIYDLNPTKPHHRDRKPKQTKTSIQRGQRIQRIQKNLAESEKKIIEYRQQKLDSRALGGIDKLIAKTLPSYIKGDSEDVPQYMRRRNRGSKQEL